MLRRFYADNFRCLVNFELELDETNILLGANGTGKSSVLTVLRKLQNLVVRGRKVEELFPTRDLTMHGDRKEQKFEIDTCVGDQTYNYALTIEHDPDRSRMRIARETLRHKGRPIFEFTRGEAQLFHDDYTHGPSYPFDWSLSGIGVLNERPDNRKLSQFKKILASYVIVNPCPPIFQSETRSEDYFLDPHMTNFVGWYRHLSQENMGVIAKLFHTLGESLPNFHSIKLKESGENSRTLKAVFRTESGKSIDYGFDQLSDGQRALIALYSLTILTDERRTSLFVDEPDNYLSLREIQPWLASAVEGCGELLDQITVVSHHPVVIDYMTGASGKWFFRDGDGPARVSSEPGIASEGLSFSEAIARGWEE